MGPKKCRRGNPADQVIGYDKDGQFHLPGPWSKSHTADQLSTLLPVAKLLVDKVPSMDLTMASANGNAMDLAVNLGRDPAIVTFLEGKGLKKTGHVSKVKAPTKAPAKKAVGKKTVKKPVGTAAAKTVAKPKPKAKAGAKK